jgi:hypothetical protein
MTGLVRKATLFAACGILAASAAMAGVPSPQNSLLPARINLVGWDAVSTTVDGAAPGATVSVTVNDLGNNPINGSSVVLDFTGCTADIRFGDQVSQLYAGLTVNCGGHTVRAYTDVTGTATFAIIGGGPAAPPGASHHLTGCVGVYADGVLLGNMTVGTYNAAGARDVGAADLFLFGQDFLNYATTADRSDFDNDGTVGAGDLFLFGQVFLNAKSNQSASSYCP